MHSMLMNAKDDDIIDHINNDPLDNRMENLRFASRSQNAHNKTKSQGKSSKYIGVSKKKNKWEARIESILSWWMVQYCTGSSSCVQRKSQRIIQRVCQSQ